MIHPLADVKSINIGENTNIWQFCVVFQNAIIGVDCNICANVLIENNVQIGDNVIIKSGVQVWDGVIIKDDVFIGPNVTFTNDLIPRSFNRSNGSDNSFNCLQTVIEKGVTIGANSTVVAGHTIGEYAFIGAGSVVTKNIPANTVWYGNPVKHKGYITNNGILLDINRIDNNGIKRNLNE